LLVGWWLGKESFSANILFGLPIVLCAVALHAWIQSRASLSPAPSYGAPAVEARVLRS
jgi:hypothetical protein